ncbi:MAG: amino acid ABC transporter substrate-binding protein [Eggerthellaceae bacterium]|jgi:polar amino acid transport system substrate-binding protein|nr:amino acid ABC transporter substrate-binding protein [Eggerthellaceae bacterium]
MKKRIAAVAAAGAALVLTLGVLAGCSGNDQAQQSASSSADASDTKLVVGFDNSYPPYGFIGDDGEYAGFDLDLAAEVASRNGWEVELNPIDWDAKDALLNQGTVNCIWNGFTMEGREDSYTFSEPYMLNEQVIVTRADSGISNLEDLAGKVVITQIDSAALDVLEGDQKALADTFAKLDTISDYNNAFMQLQAGNVDAVACDLSIAAYQMAGNPDAYAQIETPLSSEHYAVGFKKGDDAMAKTVSDTLKAMYADGTVQQLCEKYAQYGLSFDNWILK